jgi:hypothetical protein
MAGRLDGPRGLLQRDHCIRTCLLVGNGPQLVALGEKAPQLDINPKLVSYQLQKLSVNSFMGLGDPVSALEDEGLRGMEGAEIGGSAGVFAELDSEYGPSVSERLASLVEVPIDLER